MHPFYNRQGQMEPERCYFYTETVQGFKHLLADDNLKMVVIESWQYLIKLNLITIFGYVIMPNHLHLLWLMDRMNGIESPSASFAKYTGHEFKKYLIEFDPIGLSQFQSAKHDRTYQFWKRDPLAIPISTQDIFHQKLDYIHLNPVKEKWKLCVAPEEYRWSSADFYKTGTDEFGILTDFRR